MLMSEKKYSDENYERFMELCNNLKEIYESLHKEAEYIYGRGYYQGGLSALKRLADQLKNFPIKGGDE